MVGNVHFLLMLRLLFLLLCFPALAQQSAAPALHPDPVGALQIYRANLAQLRQRNPNHRDLPDLHFLLLGMGNRTKLFYQKGRLINAETGAILEQWHVRDEQIVPSEYLVNLSLWDSTQVQLRETETGVWVLHTGKRAGRLIARRADGTKAPLVLPRFADKAYGPVLRVLHHEVLMNIRKGLPVPNWMVYNRPWYRDASLMAMVLRETGNLPLIRDWIVAIRDPFDRNNHGIAEADNLGQVLFLVSLVADKTHPVVAMALDSVTRFTHGTYILGKTDYADHPVFQTKWLKYGLQSLGLPDPYIIPDVYDSYSSLFWWGFTDQHIRSEATANPRFSGTSPFNYPYLAWAEDHFYGEKRGLVSTSDYPLSWEQRASEAQYGGMVVLDRSLVNQKLSYPHTWHAAEMFLLLMQK